MLISLIAQSIMQFMKNERDSGVIEDIARRQASILRAEHEILENIWSGIPLYSKTSFNSLFEQYNESVDVKSPEFYMQNERDITNSFHSINALVRQILVAGAFEDLLSKFRNGNGGAKILLFSRSTSELISAETFFDVFSHSQVDLRQRLEAVHHQAREDIATAVVMPDEVTRIGLINPNSIFKSFIIGNPENTERIISLPTTMNGVSLRFVNTNKRESETAELALHVPA